MLILFNHNSPAATEQWIVLMLLWWPLLGLLSERPADMLNHNNSLGGPGTVDSICGHPILKWNAVTWTDGSYQQWPRGDVYPILHIYRYLNVGQSVIAIKTNKIHG